MNSRKINRVDLKPGSNPNYRTKHTHDNTLAKLQAVEDLSKQVMVGKRIAKKGIKEGTASVYKASQAKKGSWKYKYQDRADIKRFGVDPHAKDGHGRRKQESNWWMMVNLNKAPPPGEQDRMVNAMNYALTHIRNKPIHWGPNGHDKSIFTWGPEVNGVSLEARNVYKRDANRPMTVVTKLELDAPVAEIGPTYKRLHAHFTLSVEHYSMLHLHCKGFGAVFKQLYEEYMDKEGVSKEDTKVRINGSVLVWARLSSQSKHTEWLHKYAAKSQDEQ